MREYVVTVESGSVTRSHRVWAAGETEAGSIVLDENYGGWGIVIRVVPVAGP